MRERYPFYVPGDPLPHICTLVWGSWLLKHVWKKTQGMALWRWILLRYAKDLTSRAIRWLLEHEIQHQRQRVRLGTFHFYWRIWGEYRQYGWDRGPLEDEADAAAFAATAE